MQEQVQVTKFAIPEIIFGSNSLKYVVPCAKRNGAKKVLLITDPDKFFLKIPGIKS